MLRRMDACSCVYALICLSWCGGPGALSGWCAESGPKPPPDAMMLLAAYEKALVPYARMKGEWTSHVCDWPPGKEPECQRPMEHWTVLRDGDRAKFVSREIGPGAKPERVFEDVTEKATRWVSHYPDGNVLSRLSVPEETFTKRLGMAPCCPGYGIAFQRWIPGFLRASKLSAAKETVEGNAVDVLRGVSGEVEIGLWLDPSLGYSARRIRYEQRGSIGRVGQFDVKRFQQQDGVFVVAEALELFIMGPEPIWLPVVEKKVVDGKVVETNPPAKDAAGNVVMAPERRYLTKIKLVRVDFHPQFTDGDFQISHPIANGTKVHMQDAQHLNYVWQDGKIVPGPDPQALAAGRDAQFRRGGSSRRLLWVGLGAGLFLVVFFGWAMSRRRAHRGTGPGKRRT